MGVIECPKVGEVPLIVQKSDGGYGYGSTDLACVYHRLVVSRADWVIYITDLGQELHFHSVFDAATQAGWHRPGTTRIDHMGFGVVQGEDGKKFKTRSGDTVKLQDLLDDAVSGATEELKKRREGKEGEATAYDIDEAAAKIGYSAVKYFDLKQNRTSNYRYSQERMLDPNGDTAVKLLYAYARICSIQRQCGGLTNIKFSELDLTSDAVHPAERDLMLELLKFPDVIETVLKELYIHNLCEYLRKVTDQFSAFYRDCKVSKDPREKSRLLLIEICRQTLEKALTLIGCKTLDRI